MADKTLYNKNSIESLEPREFTRLKPGVYAGDTTYATQLLVEIFSNAVDEYNIGHGDQIDIKIENDVINVRDYGQGFITNSFREDGKTILQAAFDVLNTSGKYREDGSYEGNSLGSFGIGSKLTNFLSHWLKVRTYRDGTFEEVQFEEGIFKNRITGPTNLQGTEVYWQPSEEFFTNTEVEIGKVRILLKTVSCLCPGLTINLNYNGTKETYKSKNGLNDLVDAAVGDNEILTNRLVINTQEDKYKLNLVMTYTGNYSAIIIPYINTGLTDTGAHITQLKTALTREMNKFFREKKWLKDKDENLTGDDVQEGVYIVFNYTAPNVKYDAQVKTRITGIETKFEVSSFTDALKSWLNLNEKEIKSLFDKAAGARKAREAAKKARDAAREKQKKVQKSVLKFDSKLADANSKDRSQCELYVTEGDSASGHLKIARNAETQAVIPVRGKVLNCEKASIDKIMKNAEIVTILDAIFGKLNWGLDPKTQKIWYDMEKVRYGKIIIEADADIDGSHIKNLFYTFIWNLCPELIIQGYVYAGVPPLYKVIEKNGKSYKYLRNDAALEDYRDQHQGQKYLVNRMKGLGEMSEDETEECLTNPATRTIHQVTVKDINKAKQLFNQLMGDTVVYRKQFLKEYAEWSNNYE